MNPVEELEDKLPELDIELTNNLDLNESEKLVSWMEDMIEDSMNYEDCKSDERIKEFLNKVKEVENNLPNLPTKEELHTLDLLETDLEVDHEPLDELNIHYDLWSGSIENERHQRALQALKIINKEKRNAKNNE